MDSRNYRKDVVGVLAIKYLREFIRQNLFLTPKELKEQRDYIKSKRKEKIYLEKQKRKAEREYQRFIKHLKVPNLRLNLNKDIKKELNNLLKF